MLIGRNSLDACFERFDLEPMAGQVGAHHERSPVRRQPPESVRRPVVSCGGWPRPENRAPCAPMRRKLRWQEGHVSATSRVMLRCDIPTPLSCHITHTARVACDKKHAFHVWTGTRAPTYVHPQHRNSIMTISDTPEVRRATHGNARISIRARAKARKRESERPRKRSRIFASAT